MLFLRSFLFAVLMILATLIWAPVCFLCAPLPYNTRYFVSSRWNVFIIWLARTLCGIRYEFKGFENFPEGKAILLAKHQSAWETIFLLMASPKPLVFVFKKEILYIPFFGWALGLMRMIPIDRDDGRKAVAKLVKQGTRRLNDGQWVIMFPEGTRIPVGQQGAYKGGGARLAVETGTDVVPIALNSGHCWPKNSFIKKPGLITVSVGKPISPEGLTHLQLMKKAEEWIEAEMRVIAPSEYK
jgi:1-acyl-sn-glycerol-3-phosphate acyltransferase